jgi:hypothetical protein
MLFKKFLIKHKTRQTIKKSTVSRENISFKKAKAIGVIYSWEGKRKAEIINRFAEEMELTGKKVKMICYSRVDLKVIPVNIDYFNESNFSLSGKIKSHKLREFVDLRFDFLYHLDTTQNIYIEYVLAMSNARCRVSRADHTKKDLYDFMIQTKTHAGIETLCNEILHYTKALVNNVQ